MPTRTSSQKRSTVSAFAIVCQTVPSPETSSPEVGIKSSGDHVAILDRIIEHLLRCSTARLYVRVAAVNIEESLISYVNSPSKVNESVEMNASISVILSSNETLSWYRREMVADQLGIQVAALGVGEEDIA